VWGVLSARGIGHCPLSSGPLWGSPEGANAPSGSSLAFRVAVAGRPLLWPVSRPRHRRDATLACGAGAVRDRPELQMKEPAQAI